MTETELRLAKEGIVGLAAAAHDPLVLERYGRPLHPRSIQRWARIGIRLPGGTVRLEAIRMPNGRVTSRAALARFLARIPTQSDDSTSSVATD
jgi:hypothetical protein